MKKIVIFPERLKDCEDKEIFCGYIEGESWLKKENRMFSRAHRQFNRIYSAKGIHPALSSSETQGRYYICNEEDSTE